MKYLIALIFFGMSVCAVELEKEYFFTDRNITSRFFDSSAEEFDVMSIPPDKNVYKVYADLIKEPFEKHNIAVHSKHSVVVFIKKGLFEMDAIKEYIATLYEDAYAKYGIDVETIELKPLSSLDFTNPEIEKIHFNESLLGRDGGTFSVDFLDAGVKKRIYFSFDITAKIHVLKAKRDIRSGERIDIWDFEVTNAEFKNLTKKPAQIQDTANATVKAYLRKGAILSSRHLKYTKLVQKGDKLSAMMQEGGFELRFNAEALEEGNIGDTIKIKNSSDTILEAKIVEAGKVEVR